MTLDGLSGQTIDRWLENNPHFALLGKTIICYVIAKKEELSSNNYSSYEDGNWYSFLWKRKIDPHKLSDLEKNINKMSFVTWNYDRSLEQFLFGRCRKEWTLETAESIAEVVSQIEIVHLHGEIDLLPWQEKNINIVKAKYGEKSDWGISKDRSKNIRIVNEANFDDLNYLKARKIIEKSNNAYFIGCGFHKENIEKLKIDNSNDIQFAATFLDVDITKYKSFKGGRNIFKKPFHEHGTVNNDASKKDNVIANFLREVEI